MWGAIVALVVRLMPRWLTERLAKVTGVQVWGAGASMLAAAALVGALGGPFPLFLYLLSVGGLVSVAGAAESGR